MFYTVGEMARQLGVAASTLRYYDKEGLLPYVERSRGGLRMFKDEDMSWLKTIECLKKTGMPIKDIKRFIDCCVEGDSRIADRLAIVSSQREAVIRQMAELQDMLKMLNFKCWYYETAQKAGTCSIHQQMTADDVPEEFRHYIK
ncbi:MAG TPA: MerR family transcriptional regulator [Clostridiales bacterium]|nr:MerR family transcriptional regulator [Clostridiales bacterium]